MNKKLEENVIKYINQWLESGAGAQSYEVFAKLAIAMPAPCTETVCIRKSATGEIDVLTTYRDPDSDSVYGGMYHSVGSAHMLTNYINKYAPQKMLDLFPDEILNNVKSDKTWWNLDTAGTVMLRIFRRELGMEDNVILKIIQRAKFAGAHHALTPRGGDSAFIYLVDLTDYQDEIRKPVKWIPIKQLEATEDFIKHQLHRVQTALEILEN